MTPDPFENMTELSKDDFALIDQAFRALIAYGPQGRIGPVNRLREKFNEAFTGYLEKEEA